MARLSAGQVIADRYRLERVVGRGAFGAVYAAEHVVTGHKVAIKVLTMAYEGTDDPAYVRFMREASVTARLSDPHTVRVSDVGRTENGTPYIAMEFLPGDTLADRVEIVHANGAAFSEADVVELGCAVCRSLAEAHDAGLVHRDLKPANIIYAQLGAGREMIKVVDFGIAQTEDSELTKTGVALGTPQYMSPEQLQGFELDGRSDLFGLGVIMYVCLTGNLPFPGDSAMDVAMVQRDTRPPDVLKASRGKISTDLARTVHRAIAVRREDRFQSADELRKALEGLFRKTGNARDKLLREARGGVEEDDVSTRALGKPPSAAKPPSIDELSDSLSTPLLASHDKGRLPRRRMPATPTPADEAATALIDIDLDALPLPRAALGELLDSGEKKLPDDAETAQALDALPDDYAPPKRHSTRKKERRPPRGRASNPRQPRTQAAPPPEPAPQSPPRSRAKPAEELPADEPKHASGLPAAAQPATPAKTREKSHASASAKGKKGPSTAALVAMAASGGLLLIGALIGALYALGVFR